MTSMTPRQKAVLKLMDLGYVAELIRPLHQRRSKRYMMRHPQAHETDGEIVNGRTIQGMLDLGLVVKVHIPHNDKTWVFSRSRYEKMPMATGSYGSKTGSSSFATPIGQTETGHEPTSQLETSQSETLT